MKIKDAERQIQTQEYVLVPDCEYIGRQREHMKFAFDRDASTNEMKAAISVEQLRYLDQNHPPNSIVTETCGDIAATTPHLAQNASSWKLSSAGSVMTGAASSLSRGRPS